MNALKNWVYYNCVITVYNASMKSDVKYDGYIVAASETAVHLSDVCDVSSILSRKAMNGIYIFDYSAIKSVYVYRIVRDKYDGGSKTEILFTS